MSRHEDLRENERTIGQLVADASHDIQGIIRSEVALAKAEVSEGAKIMGKGAGLLVGAGVLALFGVTFLLHTLARLIAVWLPVWVGYFIVTVVLFAIAAVLALLGRKALNTAKPTPDKAIAQAQLTVAAVKDATGS
ncbi:MAG: phage holin family protein [Dermatophilaceae bacterium]